MFKCRKSQHIYDNDYSQKHIYDINTLSMHVKLADLRRDKIHGVRQYYKSSDTEQQYMTENKIPNEL